MIKGKPKPAKCQLTRPSQRNQKLKITLQFIFQDFQKKRPQNRWLFLSTKTSQNHFTHFCTPKLVWASVSVPISSSGWHIYCIYIPTCCSWWSFFQRHVQHCHIFSALLEACFQPSNLLTKRKRAMVPTKPTNWVANVPVVGSGVPRRMVTSHHLENKLSIVCF